MDAIECQKMASHVQDEFIFTNHAMYSSQGQFYLHQCNLSHVTLVPVIAILIIVNIVVLL